MSSLYFISEYNKGKSKKDERLREEKRVREGREHAPDILVVFSLGLY